MISKTEKYALWQAIRSESRPLISRRHKKFMLAGMMVIAAGVCSVCVDIGKLSGYLLVCGFIMIIFSGLALPEPWSFDNEVFRCKALRVSTIEKLKSSVGGGVFNEFVKMKESDDDKCLRVCHIFDLLDKESRSAEKACVESIANEQKDALKI
ncbi:hypothetical protein [Janthinobacterium sp. FW305-128]|uniref:hypothetical protein n=1 Tax=Janthinobacterium sp. FW305-128 TaxID=2775055 RepID=UPI001E37FBF9|nr:hypothetical protein [Janthinobacterium sp. FW305-128]MCC7684743.1 hypothetical protein [Janthinobacterium sp. FW305-128]